MIIKTMALLLASAAMAATATQQETALVKSILPSTNIQKVQSAEVDGLYKAYLPNGEILYVYPSKRLIFIGEIYTAEGLNLTARDKIKWQNDQLSTLKKATLIKEALKVDFNQGSNVYEFVMFTDPCCPYCKSVQEYFEKNKVSLWVNFFPLPFHQNAQKYSLEILSSKNPKKAMQKIKSTGQSLRIPITPQARAQLEKMKALGKKLNLRGIPRIYVIKKNSDKVVGLIDGADIPAIDEFLKKDKSDVKK